MGKTRAQQARDTLQADWAQVRRTLGEMAICDRCGATLASYDRDCSADLDDPCPGFTTVEFALRLARTARATAEAAR